MKLLSVLFLVLFSASLAAAKEEKPLNIITTTSPLASIAAKIAGSDDKVDYLIKTPEIHDYILSPKDALKLNEASIIFFTSEKLEPFIVSQNQQKQNHYIKVSTAALTLIRKDQDIDVHVWLTPKNVAIIGKAMADNLSYLRRNRASTYSDNAQALKAQMEEMEQKIQSQLRSIKHMNFAVDHNQLTYFIEHFKLPKPLEIFGSGSEHKAELTPETILQLEKFSNNKDFGCVILSEKNPALEKKLTQLNIKYLFLNVESDVNDIETMFKTTTETFVNCFTPKNL